MISKHHVILYQTYPGPKSTPELLLYYTLKGDGNDNNKKHVINVFLATGKFEDDVDEYDENSQPL